MSSDFSGKRVAVLGAGKMGGILLKALLEKGLLSPKSTVATVQHEEKARALAEKLGVSVSQCVEQTAHHLGGGFGAHQPHRKGVGQ